MTSELKQAADVAATSAGIGGITGVVRMLVLGQPGGFVAYLSIMAASVGVGIFAGLLASSITVEGSIMSEKMQWAIVIVSSLLAKDLMTGLRSLGSEFAADPVALLLRIIKALRGR